MIKLKQLLLEAIDGNKVPAEPGTEPIPSNHIRLFHYSKVSDPEPLRRGGLKISSAKGPTYGEPPLVWSSTKCPDINKITVEFSVRVDDERISRMYGNFPYDGETAQQFMARGEQHVTFNKDISPNEFIAIHEPWHEHYRYIMDDDKAKQEALQGDFDEFIGSKYNWDVGIAVQRVKQELGGKL